MRDVPPESILIIRPSALGDVCRSVSVLASLRAAFPEARLGWLVQSEFASAVSAHPALDEVVAFPRNQLRGAWRSPSRLTKSLAWLGSLKRGKWSCAIDCQGLFRSALFARATGATQRVGFSDCREGGWVFLNQRVETTAPHAVDRMMALLDPLGVERVFDMRLYTPTDAAEWWAGAAQRPKTRYAVLAPKTRWPGKEWPEDRWLEFARGLAERGVDSILFAGSKSEQPAIDKMVASLRSQPGALKNINSLAGRTSIAQLLAIVEQAQLVVGSDSAILHIAVGFDRPLVGLFGPTDPAEVGPYGALSSVVRAASIEGGGHDYRNEELGRKAMNALTIDTVLAQAQRSLGSEP